MPSLIHNGPDVPPEVFKAQEDGRLIFFCGAGISRQAGLPLFRGLVKDVYDYLGAEMEDLENAAYEQKEYDRVFTLLEDRHDPKDVRSAIQVIFDRSFNKKLTQHKHLLTLSDTGEGGHRVITTNFDDIFRMAGAEEHLIDSAPKLSIPKPIVWRTLVHLHGRLNDVSDPEYNNLVLNSRDFGGAYLVDRWASRFVTELFRNFTVVFIGYRVEDPPMKYIMDALAAARGRKEGFREAFAFVPHDGVTEATITREWLSKGVKPLLYRTRTAHTLLYQTLQLWASLFKGGLTSRAYFALRYAAARPVGPKDETVNRVIWALQEPTGNVAKAFAEQDPPPPLEWLEHLEEAGLLGLPEPIVSGADEEGEEDKKQPLIGATLVDHGVRSHAPRPLNAITMQVGRWLCRHLNDDRLIKWALQKGGILHPDFRRMVRIVVDEGKFVESPYREFWDVICSDQFATLTARQTLAPFFLEQPTGANALFDDKRIIELLTPVPKLRVRDRALELAYLETKEGKKGKGKSQRGKPKATTLRDLVDVEVQLLAGMYKDSFIEALKNNESRLERLSDELTSLLKQAVDWYVIFGQAGDDEDLSYIDLPSISEHEQNKNFRDWTEIAELLRNSFLIISRKNPIRADSLIQRWRTFSQPLFHRFVTFAETEMGGRYTDDAIERLTITHPWDLWSSYVQREVLRFLRKRGAEIKPPQLRELCRHILKGPPKRRFKKLSRADWKRIREREIWLRLAKLRQAGAQLPQTAKSKLRKLDEAYPWRLAEDNSDEFPFWMGPAEWGTLPTEFSWEQMATLLPEELADLLVRETRDRDGLLRQWQELARQQPGHVFRTIFVFFSRSDWPIDIWESAIWGLTDKEEPDDESAIKDRYKNWRVLSALLVRMPDEALKEMAHAAGNWLRASPKIIPNTLEQRYWKIWDNIWEASKHEGEKKRDDNENERAVSAAINHPSGYLAEALLGRLWLTEPKAGDTLPEGLRDRFDNIVNTEGYGGYLGRVILASRLPNLFLVDPDWTKRNLIPKMVWGVSDEVPGLWQGFMWAPSLAPGLLAVFKQPFLAAVKNSEQIGRESARNLRRLFTFICLEHPGEFKRTEIQGLLRSLSADQLADVARALENVLESAKERREALWKDKVSKFIRLYWPRATKSRSSSVSDALASLAVSTGQAFPNAVKEVTPFLIKQSENPHFLIDIERHDPGFPERYPEPVFKLLYQSLSKRQGLRHYRLRNVLDRIAISLPKLKKTLKFKNLEKVA